MGRELTLNRIDFMNNGDVIIRKCDDTYVCGRTEFTGDIASFFYRDKVDYLIVDYGGEREPFKDTLTIHVKTEDPGWSDIEFDMEFGFIDEESILYCCDEGIKKDNAELKRESDMLEDARAARRNTNTIEEFNNFSELIDELTDWMKNYREDAAIFKQHFLSIKGELPLKSEDTEYSYILITLSE